MTVASTQIDYAEVLLDDIRKASAAANGVLREARTRRDCTTAAGRSFPGVLRSYNSGSVAHGTVIYQVSDADCGIVLDRRHYPELGPDGDGEGPIEIAVQVADVVIEAVLEDYPDATCETDGKRAILIRFNEQIAGQDPSVDLIVALNRRDAPGLWIPNRHRDDWDASDPIEHTELLTAEPKDLRVHRARAIRLAKVCVKRDEDKAVLSSFNLEALALEHITEVLPMAEALANLFVLGAADIAIGDTPDPAGVSDPIKLPEGIARASAVRRLRFFGECFEQASRHYDDPEAVKEALAGAFPEDLIEGPSNGKRSIASALRNGHNHPGVPAAFGVGATGLRTPRSYGRH